MTWNNRAALPELHYVTRLLRDAQTGDIGAAIELDRIEFSSHAAARVIRRARAYLATENEDSHNAA